MNRKELGAIACDIGPGFLDHDGPGGKQGGREGDRAMMAGMHKLLPDLRAEVGSTAVAFGRIGADRLSVSVTTTSGDVHVGHKLPNLNVEAVGLLG